MSYRLAIAGSLLVLSLMARADDATTDIVSAYYDAYNSHDIETMMSMVADDVKWMEALGEEHVRFQDGAVTNVDEFIVRTESRSELADALTGYFESFPTARSIIRSIEASEHVVTVFEEAVWDFAGVPMSQCATAVYDIDDGVILSVWYSNEQPCGDESPSG